MSDDPTPADLDIRTAKPGLSRRLSLVWLVPLLALAIVLGVAYQNYASRGVLITIAFESASGVKADETEIRYRDVKVGEVERVEFADGLGDVLVHARIDQSIWPFLDADARFWVVQPDVSVRGITGLDTVLSGVYIEGTWDDDPQVAQYEFTGLRNPPLTRGDQRGVEIVLRTRDASTLTAGAPVLHKGIQVGYLEDPQLGADGQSVRVNAFIEAPYNRLVTSATRFWDTSGFSVTVGANGVELNVNSLASLIEGGIAFDTVVSGGEPIRDGHQFDLFVDEITARNSLFNDPDQPRLEIAALFDTSVAGLSQGSEVRFQGIRVGEVSGLTAVVVEDASGNSLVQLRTVLSIEPGRLGLPEEATPEDALDLLANLVSESGLRARLVTGNILSGSLVVELLEAATPQSASMDLDAQPYPLIPTTFSNITDVADTADDVLNRINNLPVEELMSSAINLMDSLERLANEDSFREAPESLVALLEETRALVASDEVQAVPGEVREVVAGVREIVSDLAAAQLAAQITTTLDTANGLAVNLTEGTESLPEIMAELEALAAKANALDFEALVGEASATLAAINGLLSSEETAALPANLTATLQEATDLIDEAQALLASEDVQAIPSDLRASIAEINGILSQVQEEQLVEGLAATIESAEAAAANINEATTGLPAITAELEGLAAQARELELDALVDSATQTLVSIDRLIASDDTQDLPASVSGALDELRLFLAEVREGGAIANVNAALASANEAAEAIEEAAAALPALAAQARTLASQTSGVLESYGDRSRFNAETLATLREIQEAADAVSALARAIQRNPNSLLTGR